MPDLIYDWSGQVTDKNDRKIQPGEVVEMTNIRRKLDGGTIQKRLGYDRTSVTSFQSGATYTTPSVSIECSDVKIVRDGIEQLWLLNSDGVGYVRGTAPRAAHVLRGLDTGSNLSRKPCTVYKSSASEIWHFVADEITANRIRVTVTDSNTGIVKVKTTSHTMLDDVYSCCAVLDASGTVWFFHTDGSATIYSCKFTAADVAPTIVPYVSLAGRHWTTVDAHLLTAGTHANTVIVYADRFSYGPGGGLDTFGHHISKLNTATGVPSLSVEVSATQNDTFNAVTEGGTLFGSGSGDAVYVCAWKPNPAADNGALLQLFAIATGTLVVGTTTTLVTMSIANLGNDDHLGVATGFVDPANGNRVVFASWVTGDQSSAFQSSSADIAASTVVRYTYNGTSTTSKTLSNEAYVASKPFAVNGKTYFLTGFDALNQCGYFVRDTEGRILDVILSGSGVPIYHGGGYRADVLGSNSIGLIDGHALVRGSSHVVTIPVSGNKAWATVLKEGFAQRYTQPVLAEIDFAAVYSSKAPNIVPGGLPRWVSARDVAREQSPIHYPSLDMTFTNGGGALIGTTRFAYLFAVIDANGDIVRSTPRIKDLTFNVNASNNEFTISVPTYSHAQGTAWIEIYASPLGGGDLHHHYTLTNAPLSSTVSFVWHSSNFSALGELLYTTGGALDNGPAPSARVFVTFKGRLFAFGAEDGAIYFTKVKQAGRGYEWNEALAIDWTRRAGNDWWACEISPDALAFGDGVSIGVIAGPGPDGNAQGEFTVTTLRDKKQPNHPRMVTTGPGGCYFIAKDSNRPCVLSEAGVREISKGFENYRGFTFGVFAGHTEGRNDAKGEVFFVGNSGGAGKIVVLDCDRPTADQPEGTWILHEKASGWPAWIGAEIIGGQLHLLEAGAASTVRTWSQGVTFGDNGEICLKRWKTGRYAPAGFFQEFDSDRASLSSERLGGDSAYRVTVFNDNGASEVHDDAASVISDVGFRTNFFRTREIQFLMEETSATGEGRKFDGMRLEYNPYNQTQNHRRTVA